VSATTGRYFFDTRTTSFSLSSGLAYTTGRLTLRVALPIVAQNTPLVTASVPAASFRRLVRRHGVG
jgi:hypothetical protein